MKTKRTSAAAKRYEAMTKAERRVAIAQDVIKAINARKFASVRASYGYARTDVNTDVINQEWARKNIKMCTVCARGAMMLCRIEKYNEVEVHAYFGVDSDHTTEALRDAFTKSQLDLIEAAFEEDSCFPEAYRFGMQFDNAEDSLIGICQNIIDHRGTFKPRVLYEIIK